MTICDIAKQAGVSIATVSRVINGTGYVKAETKKKVEEVIEKNNYRPNAVAKNFTKKDSSLIGLIMPGRVDLFQSSIINAISTKINEMNLNLLFHSTGEDIENEHHALKVALEQRIKGLVFIPIVDSDETTNRMLDEMENSGIPVVLIDRDVYDGDFDAVIVDNRRAVYDGVQALLDAGHKDIGVVTSPEPYRDGRTRVEGYLKCLNDHKIIPRDEYIVEGGFSQEAGYRACEIFMALEQPPTAIIASNSSETMGCIRYFNENRIAIGKDISLIGFDDISTIRSSGYPISIIELPVQAMGERAFDMLMERIIQPEKKRRSREVVLETRLTLHGTEKMEH